MQFHYPGYQYLGPGTDLKKAKKPINKLDRAAKKHDYHYNKYDKAGRKDYYWRFSKADEDFIKATNNINSVEGKFANYAFKGKRFLNKAFGVQDLPENTIERYFPKKKKVSNEDSKSNMAIGSKYSGGTPSQIRQYKKYLNIKGRSVFKRGRGKKRSFRKSNKRSTKRRRTGSKKLSFNMKVLRALNPTRYFKYLRFMRMVGVLNSSNYINLTGGLTSSVNFAVNGYNSIMNGLDYALNLTTLFTPGNWEASSEYWYKSSHQFKISNNSNVTMKGTIYYVIHNSENDRTFTDFITDATLIANTDWWPNTTGIPAQSTKVATPNCHFYTPPYDNILDNKTFKKNIYEAFRIFRGKRMIFAPGQTKSFNVTGKKWKLATKSDFYNDDNGARNFPRGSMEIFFKSDGETLPGTRTPDNLVGPYTVLQTGINQGDWSWQQNYTISCMKKPESDARFFVSVDTSSALYEDTASHLLTYGPDNNIGTVAV